MTKTHPRWLKLALADLGIRETPGIANNPVLMKRFATLTKTLGIFYNADSVPWCGAIMAWWMTQCGITPPAIAVRAKSWANFGANLRWSHIAPGAVIVMERQGGGHVTMYLGHNATHFFGVGGNQSDSVNIASFPLSRVIDPKTNELAKGAAIRWPRGEPVLGKPTFIASLAGAQSGVRED